MRIIKKNKKILTIILTMICILSCMNISTSYANIVENFNFKKLFLAILIITYNNEKGVFQNNFLQYFETLFLINLNISSL